MYTLLYLKWVINEDLLYSPGTVARQAPLSMGFSRQEYWSGLPCPPPRDLPHPGIKPRSPALRADSSPFELPQEAHSTGNFAQCYVLAWMEGSWGRMDHVCAWLSPFTAHWKLPQHCWWAIPQYKIKSLKFREKRKTRKLTRINRVMP